MMTNDVHDRFNTGQMLNIYIYDKHFKSILFHAGELEFETHYKFINSLKCYFQKISKQELFLH